MEKLLARANSPSAKKRKTFYIEKSAYAAAHATLAPDPIIRDSNLSGSYTIG